MKRLGDLPPAFSAEFIDAAIRGLRRAYTVNQPFHRPDLGHNALTYGTLVWNSGRHFLVEEMRSVSSATIDRTANTFDLLLPGFRVTPYKLGHRLADDVWSSFPHNDEVTDELGSINAEQLALNLTPSPVPVRWVLGHFGNPVDGFCKAYVCAPLKVERGSVTAWLYCVRIDSDEAASGAVRPAPKKIERPLVRPRRGAEVERSS